MKNNSISPLINEAERVLREAVKYFVLDTKPETIRVTVQSKGRKNAVGWFWAERWADKTQDAKDRLNEINMSAEHLVSHNMGELLLHELAHAENHTKGIKDCSGRAHNKHFKTMAEHLGLEVKPRDKSVGFGYTDLAEPAKTFLKKIDFKEKLFTTHRVTGLGKKGSVGSRLLKCECQCGYVVRVTQKWIDVGLPTCPCGEEMEVA